MNSKNSFSTMGELFACRLCLIMDVNMYNLRLSPLDTYFESIFGLSPHNHELLTHACVECAYLVKKFYMFKEKCMRGINILQNMLNNNIQLCEKSLQTIDREHCKLTSTISLGLPQNYYLFLYNSNPEDSSQQPNTSAVIKLEIARLDYDGNSHSDDDDDDDKFIIKKEPEETIETQKHKSTIDVKEQTTKNVKSENLKPKNEKKSRILNKTSKCNINKKIYNTKTLIKKRNTNKLNSENKIKPKVAQRSVIKPGPKIKRIIKSMDKDILEHFEVVTRTLEEQKAEIRAREHSASYQNATLRCNICFKVFVHHTAYDHHMKKHDPSVGPMECEVCGFRFHAGHALVKHRQIHIHRYVCKLCHRVLLGAHTRAHREWHTGTTYQCKHCSEIFNHSTSYLSHLRIKHPSQHICNLCGNSFINDKGLRQHRTTMHKDATDVELKGPRCDKCAIHFIDQKAFDLHLGNSSNHIGDSDIATMCRQCGASFSKPEQLRFHQKKEHAMVKPNRPPVPSKVTNWPKKCEHCEEMIPSARENWYHYLRDHRDKEYSHTANPIYMCEICGYKSTNSGNLKYHISDKHSTAGPYSCPHCPKSFGTPYKYKNHLLTHSDDKPFACTVCTRAFNKKGNLQRHEKTHTGLRPYLCKICGKTFGSTTTRNNHVKYVHYKAPPPIRKRHVKTEKRGEHIGD